MSSTVLSRHPLPGIREATTAPLDALLERATEVLAADERLAATYLVGGFARGMGDAWSDLDLHSIATEGTIDNLQATWTDLAHQIAPTVSIQPFFVTVGGTCITSEWLRFDLAFHPPGKVDPTTLTGMVPLVDRAGILPPGPVPETAGPEVPFFPEVAVRYFLYMLGNVVAAIGRNEPLCLANGAAMMRDLGLVPLLLAEQGHTVVPPGRKRSWANPFPFTKRLAPYLTPEQRQLLAALPPLAANIDSGIDAIVALARVFLPRGRDLAAATRADWPETYEAATIAYFERSTGIVLF